MSRFLLDLGSFVSCVSFVGAAYLWMGWFQTTV